MHDLIQQMGWRIVSRESPQERGRRSRLWLCKDVFHVLKKNTVSGSVYRHKLREVYICVILANFLLYLCQC